MIITGTKSISVYSDNDTNDKVAIRAKNVTSDSGRIPAGFYVVVHHSDLEYRTETKRPSADDNVAEWDGPIPMCDHFSFYLAHS